MKNKSFKRLISKLFLSIFIALLVSSCKKQKEELAVFGENIETSLEVKTNETLTLNPQIVGNATTFEWLEDNKVVGSAKTYAFKKAELGTYSIILKIANAAGASTLEYKVKVVGPYTNGILLINGTNTDGSAGNISYLDENENLSLDVFSKENNNNKLSKSISNSFLRNSELYVVSANGPENYISKVNRETLKLEASITSSGIANLSYFATTDGKTGYVMSSLRKKIGLYPVDFASNTIRGTLISGTADLPRIPIAIINDNYILPVGKQLVKIVDGTVITLQTYTENISGIVKTSDKQVWIGIAKGSSSKAKMIRVDQNFNTQETVELEDNNTLPANGILTSSGVDEFIYWQETNNQVFCRFNTATKKAENVVTFKDAGFLFPTAWKVSPKTGELYVADSPGTFSGTDSLSDLYIYGKDRKLRKKITAVGHQVVDVIFPK